MDDTDVQDSFDKQLPRARGTRWTCIHAVITRRYRIAPRILDRHLNDKMFLRKVDGHVEIWK